MKVIALICLLVAGACANYYGAEPAVVRVESAPAAYSTVSDLPAYGATVVRNNIPIVRLNQEIKGGVSDNTEFESGNGIKVSESTQVVAGRGGSYDDGYGKMIQSDSSLVRSGSYSYTGADGVPIALSWTADENGFRATGSHLPTPPPVPAEIAASLVSAPVSSSYGSYAAPAVVVRESGYAAPAVVVRESGYAAPAPAVVIRSSGY